MNRRCGSLRFEAAGAQSLAAAKVRASADLAWRCTSTGSCSHRAGSCQPRMSSCGRRFGLAPAETGGTRSRALQSERGTPATVSWNIWVGGSPAHGNLARGEGSWRTVLATDELGARRRRAHVAKGARGPHRNGARSGPQRAGGAGA